MAPTSAALRRLLVVLVLPALLLGLTASLASAAQTADDAGLPSEDADSVERLVEILPLSGFLDPPTSAQITDVLDLAAADGSVLVVLQLDAGGGVSVDTDELLAAIEASPVPVAVLVGPLGSGPRAAGAAGLLWLAADVRAVALDATVGPLDPADLTDLTDYLVAEVAGGLSRDVDDEQIVTRLLDDEVTAEELEALGTADLAVAGLEALLLELDGTEVAGQQLTIQGDEVGVRFHSLGLVRRLLHAATTAPFIYLLLTVGLGMLLFEVFQPGFGVAGLAGLITAGIGVFGLFVLPVTWWAVALVVLGLLLYAVDTAVAGFGPVTLAATVAFAVGSLNFYDADVLTLPVWLVVVTTVSAFAFFVLVMTSILRAQAGPEGVTVEDLVGKAGIVRSVLNPEGHVYLDGALWRARWTGEAKRAKVGTPVRVHAVDGPVVLVEPFEPASAGSVAGGGDAAASGPAEA
ncbi:NfeD family protein [Nitriliruptor alkaliphilus]|uniref:NfeD family protein n=1 Tax=Nitriliruptor alkaliphilus TaxID=427918 RepID=UPI0006989873|nr:NfeD family protein [Nitriliruptor alkaliphilus]